jgi:hypothetical protein
MDFTFDNLSADIKIWHCKLKKFYKITALFDTGARISAIDPVAFRNLGYDFSDARNSFVSTASHSRIAVKRTVIHDLMLGDFEIGPFAADVIEFPIVSYQMILGLNIIKEFETLLDFESQIIKMFPTYDSGKVPLEQFDYNSSRFSEIKLNSSIFNIQSP